MAHDRIDPREARSIWFPKFTVENMTASELLSKEINQLELINRVPVNTPLLASVEREGFKNPFLCMENYWCIAGQQRLRVAFAIREENPSWDSLVVVYRLLEHPWEVLHLFPHQGSENIVGNTAVATYVQCLELVFKSLYYPHNIDDGGNDMKWYEELGDRLEGWNVKPFSTEEDES